MPPGAAGWRGGDGANEATGTSAGPHDLEGARRAVGSGSRSCSRSRSFGRREAARGLPPRRILDGVLYVLRTGCQWKAVPREYGSGLDPAPTLPAMGRVGHAGQACGGVCCSTTIRTSGSRGSGSPPMRRCTKPRWVGKKTGPNPTDRAKGGTKRHHLTDTAGIPWRLPSLPRIGLTRKRSASLLDARVGRAPADTEPASLSRQRATTTPMPSVPSAGAGTCRTSAGGARSGGSVAAAPGRGAGSSNVPRPGSIAAASCSSGGRRNRRTTSPSSTSPPHSSSGGTYGIGS